MKKINFDYLNVFKEPFLFVRLFLRRIFVPRRGSDDGAILIVNVCLIGEFAASLPAMRAFIEEHPGAPIDLIVNPELAALARNMRGVRTVHAAHSVFNRKNETVAENNLPRKQYALILVMRISRHSYNIIKDIKAKKTITGFSPMVRYGAHMALNLAMGKSPKSWREINFEIVGQPARTIIFSEIFDKKGETNDPTERFPELKTSKKIVIIHTGASWVMNYWKIKNWISLLKILGTLDDFNFVFIGSTEEEQNDFHSIADKLDFPIYSLIGKNSLASLPSVLQAANYFIGVDSGPRNFAHLVDLPSITILGPGPHMFAPPNPRDIALDRSSGRGIFQRFFQVGQRKIIDTITAEDVAVAFKTRLYQAKTNE